MKIKTIRIYRQPLPVKGAPYTMSLSQVTELDSTIVQIITDTGVSGFGETCPLGSAYQPAHAKGARAAIAEMAPHLLGMDPLQIGVVGDQMDRALTGHAYAKAALDIALWDVAGKVYGKRTCDLLGGARRDRIPSYYAVGLATPEETCRLVEEKQSNGFERLQLKVGGRALAEDIAVVRKVFEIKNSNVRIALDANRALTTRDVLHLSQACRDLELVLEQPCATYEEVRAVKPQLHHPVYLDENTVDLNTILTSIHDGVADGFGMKVTRIGGISAMTTVRDICRATNKPMSVDDSWGGDIIAAACVHIAATLKPELSEGVWIAEPYIDGHYDEENGISIDGGGLNVPTGPGLGVVPDIDKLTLHQTFE